MKEAQVKDMPIGQTLRFAWRMVSPNMGALAFMLGCVLVFALVEVMLPVVGKHIFENIAAFDAQEGGHGQVWRMVALFFGLLAGFWAFRFALFFVFIPFTAKYIRRLAEGAFERVQLFSTAWHNDTFAGVSVRNITRGMWALDGVVDLLLLQFIPTLLIVLGTAGYLMCTGHMLVGLGLFGFLSVFIFATGTVSLKVVAPLNRVSNEIDSKIGGYLADAITCNGAVKAFGSEREECARFKRGMDDWQLRKTRSWYAGTMNGVLQTMLILAMRAGFMLYALMLWDKGQGSVGDIYYYFTISAIIQGYLRDFGFQLRMLQNHINDLDPVAAYMQMRPSIVDVPQARALDVSKGEIAFKNVSFGYKPHLPPLFDDFSVRLEAGKTVALVGASGSGKTSFVKLVQRLYDLQGGAIEIDGQNIADVSQRSLHRAIALVPQDPVLFHRSLAENIAYARPEASMDEICAAAQDAYIVDYIDGLPEGYGTLVGERGIKLSGGERQRVAIARAVLAQRPILILDEATSALDSISEKLIQKALEKLMRGRTTLIIAHRLSTIRQADRILVFDGGRIVEDGIHEQLLMQNGIYKALYEAQVDGLI